MDVTRRASRDVGATREWMRRTLHNASRSHANDRSSSRLIAIFDFLLRSLFHRAHAVEIGERRGEGDVRRSRCERAWGDDGDDVVSNARARERRARRTMGVCTYIYVTIYVEDEYIHAFDVANTREA